MLVGHISTYLVGQSCDLRPLPSRARRSYFYTSNSSNHNSTDYWSAAVAMSSAAGVCAITSNAQERVRRLAEASKREASAIGGIFTCGAASAAVAVASAVAAAAVGSETIEFFHPFRTLSAALHQWGAVPGKPSRGGMWSQAEGVPHGPSAREAPRGRRAARVASSFAHRPHR